MILIKESPVKMRIAEFSEMDLSRLKKTLSFKKKEIQHAMTRMKKGKYFLVQKMGEEAYELEMNRLKNNLVGSVLYEDFDGYYTLPGLRQKIQNLFQGTEFVDMVEYPEFQPVPWEKLPEHKMRYYQDESVAALLKDPNSHVELPTGSGKSTVIINMVKEVGLPTIIATPSASIAQQIYKEMIKLLGKKNVGLFGDGKREIGKRFLVCVGKSLSLVEDAEEKEAFKKYQVILGDEAHTIAADQFHRYNVELLGHCPYRWYFSATPERNDGRDILLEGLIGNCVYLKTLKELQDQGYLAKLTTMIFNVNSKSSYKGKNGILCNQKHIYQNKEIIKIIGMLVREAMATDMPTLILIDEKSQEELLLKELGAIYAFAVGGSDTNKICEDFNKGLHMCVVGTSAVSVGTDFKRNKLTINWKGNRASTTTKQGAIGRSTRIDEASGKFECKIVDFLINNVDSLNRHGMERVSYYEEVGPVEFYDVG
jgi:superfamily II DNA or RNA helicase